MSNEQFLEQLNQRLSSHDGSFDAWHKSFTEDEWEDVSPEQAFDAGRAAEVRRARAEEERLADKCQTFREGYEALSSEVERTRPELARLRASNAALSALAEYIVKTEKARMAFPLGGQSAFAASPGEWAEVVRLARAALADAQKAVEP